MTDSMAMEVDVSREDRATWSLYHWAAYDGHLDILQSAADRRSDLTAKDAKGRTPLHLAADRGLTEAVKLLLDKNVATDEPDKKGRTPLHLAALKGHAQCVAVLLSQGANANAIDSQRLTPLLTVSLHSRHPEQVVRLLLQYQADLNVTDVQGNTPLHVAAMRGLEGTVKELLNAGAQHDVGNIWGTTPLISAIHGFDLSEPDSETEVGTEAVAHLLIESGVAAEFSLRGGYWGHALNAAVAARMDLAVEAMVRKGAKLTQPDREGRTAIHIAAYAGVLYTQLSMVNHHRFGGQDKQGRNILHYAVSHKDNFATVNRILSANPNFNTPDFDGWLPLHWACKGGSRRMVSLLLDAEPPFGNNLSGQEWKNLSPEKRVWTPLRIALFHGNESIAALLRERTGHASVAALDPKKPKRDELNQIQGRLHEGIICNGCHQVS